MDANDLNEIFLELKEELSQLPGTAVEVFARFWRCSTPWDQPARRLYESSKLLYNEAEREDLTELVTKIAAKSRAVIEANPEEGTRSFCKASAHLRHYVLERGGVAAYGKARLAEMSVFAALSSPLVPIKMSPIALAIWLLAARYVTGGPIGKMVADLQDDIMNYQEFNAKFPKVLRPPKNQEVSNDNRQS